MMKLKNRVFWLGMCVIVLGCLSGLEARAENERVTRPTSVGLEVFGRGLLYSFHVDQVLAEELSAGVGYGSVGLKRPGGGDLDYSARMVPVYVNYYFMPEQGSIFATAGANLVLNMNDAKNNESQMGGATFSSSGVMPTFGVGYENRSPTGVILRLTAYGLLGKSLYPWFGFDLGFAF